MRRSCSTEVAVAVAESWAAVQNGNSSAQLSGSRPSMSSIELVPKIM